MKLRSSLMLGAILATASLAHGQPVKAPDAAELAYQEGKRLYDIQEWDAAIAKFKEAYKLRSDAASLFNIAQSYRLKGDCAQAVTFYKTYKRNYPAAANLAKVEKFITELEATPCKPVATPAVNTNPTPDPTKPDPLLVNPTKVDPPPVDATKPTTPVMVGPVDQTSDLGRTKRIVGYSLLGVGGGALVSGVIFGLRARGKANDVEDATPGTVWDPKAQTEGERFERTAKILFAVSGAALIGGGVLVYLGRSTGTESSRVSLAPTGDGGAFVWSGTW